MPGPQTDIVNITGGTLTANGQNIDLVGCANYNMVNIRLDLTSWQGAITITGSIDGTNFETIPLMYVDALATNGAVLAGTLTHAGATTGTIRLVGYTRGAGIIRVSSTSFTGGTMAVNPKASIGVPEAIPAMIGASSCAIGGNLDVLVVRANYTSAQTDAALVTLGSTTRGIATRLTVTASNANSVNVSFFAGWGAANTPSTTGVVGAHPGIPAGGGFTTGDGSGILGVGAAGDDFRVTCSVPTGGSIDVVLTYLTVG